MRKQLGILSGVLISIFLSSAVFGEASPKVVVNGKELDSKAVIVDERTLVPVRGVFEELGFNIEWNAETKTAILKNDEFYIEIKNNEKSFACNQRIITPDVPQQNIDSRFYLPLRAVSESINANVSWNAETKTAIIEKEIKIDKLLENQIGEDKVLIGTNAFNGKPLYKVGGCEDFEKLSGYSNGILVNGKRIWFDMSKEEVIRLLGTPSFEHQDGTMINYKETSIGLVKFDFEENKLSDISLFGADEFDVQYGNYLYTHMDGEKAADEQLGGYNVVYSREPALVIKDCSIRDDRGYTYIPIRTSPNKNSGILVISKEIIE